MIAVVTELLAPHQLGLDAVGGPALLADVGRWIPLGAVTILAVYCLTQNDLTAPAHGVPELAAVAVPIVVHWWRRNAALRVITGTRPT